MSAEDCALKYLTAALSISMVMIIGTLCVGAFVWH
jgi:hypothetical protein